VREGIGGKREREMLEKNGEENENEEGRVKGIYSARDLFLLYDSLS
jgi:hypothetical protein